LRIANRSTIAPLTKLRRPAAIDHGLERIAFFSQQRERKQQ
jgi:hypothetical protein